MPPKPMTFKTPDGKEFTTRAEWRDYMMLTFYSFKNKINEPEPLVKNPGDIDGQMFEIADCEGSTMIVMDHCAQVQIDQLKNCRVFIGACPSSIFIRDCQNCVFYTSCQQLRLRDVVNSDFYIYSMAEVHIEFSNNIRFAPFNGGYPEMASHLAASNLDPAHNLWYDIFDHNDPAKTHEHWSLIPTAEYEQPWFPAGPCTPAITVNAPGSVQRFDADVGQAYGVQQMIADANALKVGSGGAPPPPAAAPSPAKPPAAPAAAPPAVPATVPAAAPASPAKVPVLTHAESTDDDATTVGVAGGGVSDEEAVASVITKFASFKAGNDLSKITTDSFFAILPSGVSLPLADFSAAIYDTSLWSIEAITANGSLAWAVFWVASLEGVSRTTAVFQKDGSSNTWKIAHAHKSSPVSVDKAPSGSKPVKA